MVKVKGHLGQSIEYYWSEMEQTQWCIKRSTYSSSGGPLILWFCCIHDKLCRVRSEASWELPLECLTKLVGSFNIFKLFIRQDRSTQAIQ